MVGLFYLKYQGIKMEVSHEIKAALNGSIANPAAAQMVIDSLEATPAMAAAVANIATADATDLPTAEALANATKAKVNALLAALRTAGLMAP